MAAWDPHLRSTHDVDGHHIQATDGEIGHVEDFIVDDETWAIRYLIIDTQNWWPGKKVLISPKWIERVSWPESKVFVDLTCEAIKRSPEYLEESLPTRDYETRLHRHYNREGYWVDEPDAKYACLAECNHNEQKRNFKKERITTMLNKAKTLKGYKLNSRDGVIGKVNEFYFDDHHWTIRYLVADTGGWLTGRQVLISPYALGFVNKEEQTITVDLPKNRFRAVHP